METYLLIIHRPRADGMATFFHTLDSEAGFAATKTHLPVDAVICDVFQAHDLSTLREIARGYDRTTGGEPLVPTGVESDVIEIS